MLRSLNLSLAGLLRAELKVRLRNLIQQSAEHGSRKFHRNTTVCQRQPRFFISLISVSAARFLKKSINKRIVTIRGLVNLHLSKLTFFSRRAGEGEGASPTVFEQFVPRPIDAPGKMCTYAKTTKHQFWVVISIITACFSISSWCWWWRGCASRGVWTG